MIPFHCDKCDEIAFWGEGTPSEVLCLNCFEKLEKNADLKRKGD